jgi:two-component system LytT family sensor kinase
VLSGRFQTVPQFWLVQTLGWFAFAAMVFVDVLPKLSDRAPVAYNAVFVGSLFAGSLILRLFCRQMWRRNLPWPRAMLQAALMAAVLGLPCGILAEWSSNLVRRHSVTGDLLFDAWGGVLYATFVLISWSALYLGIKHYQAFQAEHERAVKAETLAREARLQALRYQLNPHFLFNALNAISTLVVKGESAAANHMLVQLAGFLRLTLEGPSAQEIPVSREISNTQQYLEIEKARLGNRLELDFAVGPDTEQALVPSLLLQPLVENAIRHGIAPNPDGGCLTIRAYRVGDRLQITISDNGAGGQPQENRSGMQRRGVGLSNTIERLRVLYGSDHRLVVHWPPEGGCRVEIEFPFQEVGSIVPVGNGG